jgi:hypothetical protein
MTIEDNMEQIYNQRLRLRRKKPSIYQEFASDSIDSLHTDFGDLPWWRKLYYYMCCIYKN